VNRRLQEEKSLSEISSWADLAGFPSFPEKRRVNPVNILQNNPSKEADTMSKQEALKAAFIFIAPEGDPVKHRSWIRTPHVELLAIAVKDYEAAERLSQELLAEGIKAIELCGGFGNVGTAKVVEAVKAQIPVGVVRFDLHPGLGFKSGDEIFAK
jgi:Family of unknown function (DUF6506)